MIRPRPFLCPGPERDAAQELWTPSEDNRWWRPRTRTYPATNRLLPGDVLLFVNEQPTAVASLIEKVQRRWGSTGPHARFTHAALYFGLDHLICEAAPGKGVVYSSLEPRLDNCCWIARRWPNLTLAQRYRVVSTAAGFLGKPYGWKPAVLEGLKQGLGTAWDQDVENGLVCSRLVDRSLTLALVDDLPSDQLAFHPDPKTWITPAILSETSRLDDIDVGWRRAL